MQILENANKVHFISLGCPRNLVDTEVMLGLMLQAGYEVTESAQEADYLVVNTCGFLESSRQESLDTIGMLMDEKKENAKMVVTGCMVQKHKEVVKEHFPQVDYLLGSGDVGSLLDLIHKENRGERVTSAKSFLQSGEVPRVQSTPKHYAYLKIAEGCKKKCAFCLIPDIKGKLKSKTIDQITKEFNTLLKNGVQEVILIAQDLGDWGKDHEPRQTLTQLLKEILKIQGDYWLRLLYLYPDEITDDLIDIIKNDSRVCRYLDMPMQHIDDSILKAMRRKTTGGDIRNTLQKLRQEIPEIVIRTSLMVGFPGETEEQFQLLKTFVQDHPLDNIGVFQYSAEVGTTAASMEDQIDEDVKERRYHELMQTQLKVLNKKQQQWIGKTIPVIVEGYHPETDLLMVGRHYGQCPEIDGQVVINDGRKVKAFGKRYLVEITQVADYDLIGKVVGPIPQKRVSKPLKML
ncbi:MAG: 30S ribosomal protein S12 methylthiotransferase RimO [Parachlamydiales bacterium]|nr:30S ribosomal protein S12 methylthiotransferase RimO [Parachlamydiales bacterium]